ncbi:N-myc-interactor [Gouania willdenowi]|uniref:N-myc-interactor-like n=1 Tax=Gouania willdenowi TaxID=441366 RepID=A0A8C5NHB6_GOUWI|nr:N-myc-interactor-like [Gouania willdenowi]
MDEQQDHNVLLSEAKQELEKWKSMVEKAMDTKDKLTLEKLDEDENKVKIKQEVKDCLKQQERLQKKYNQSLSTVQSEILKLEKSQSNLLVTLKQSQAKLKMRKAEATKLKEKFKICAHILHTNVNFLSQIKEEMMFDSDQPIKSVFTISQRAAVLLQGGQALVTFEEEKVASQVLKLAECSVSYEQTVLKVRPKRIQMDPSVKFEVHLDVNRKQLKISNVPPSMPEERVKDRLHMSFSRPSRGGGEVEQVEYDKNTGTGCITFLHPGVAESLAQKGQYSVDLDPVVTVQVGLVFTHQLRRFQIFLGTVRRTVLLDGIKDTSDEEDLQDHLEIHFQKPSNGGGEIENIKYISRDKCVQAFFCESQNSNGSVEEGK